MWRTCQFTPGSTRRNAGAKRARCSTLEKDLVALEKGLVALGKDLVAYTAKEITQYVDGIISESQCDCECSLRN